MPPKSNSKCSTRSATAGSHNELPLLSQRTSCLRAEDAYYHTYSSGLDSVNESSNIGNAGPSSVHLTDSSVRSLGLNSERDCVAEDQMSTEPVPADFDHTTSFMPPSPHSTYHSVPITRAKARASAKSVDQNAQSDLVGSLLNNVGVLAPGDKRGRHTHLPRSPRRDSTPKTDKPKVPLQSIKGFDGSVEKHSSNGAESSKGPAGSLLKTDRSMIERSTNEDDLYRLPESDKSGDESEDSMIADITGRPKRKGKKKVTTFTYSSKQRRNNQTKTGDVSSTTKKSNSPADEAGYSVQDHGAQNQAANTPDGRVTRQSKKARISRRNVKVSTQKASNTIQNSQVCTQDLLSPIAAKSKGTINRRPKRPFGASSPNEHKVSSQGVLPFSGDISIDKQPIAGQKIVDSSTSSNIAEPQESASRQGNKRSTHDIHLPGVKQEKGCHRKSPPVGKGKCRDIGHSHLNRSLNTSSVPHILSSSDQQSQSTDMEYGYIHPKNRTTHDPKSRSSKRPCHFEASKRPTKKSRAALDKTAPNNNADSFIEGHLSGVDPTPLAHPYTREALDEATPTEISVAELSPASFHDQIPEENEDILDDYTPAYGFWKLRQVDQPTESSSAENIPTKAGSQRQQKPGNAEHLPCMKVCKGASEAEESLHPNSIAWAKRIAERSHKKDLVSVPVKTPGGVDSADQLLPTERGSHKPRKSKREIMLQNRRDAVFESVQEVTAAMLQHMQSKESTVNEIVENYRRNGQQLADAMLNRQAIELSDVIHAFDRKCHRLSKMLDEGARLARTIRKKVANEDDQYYRAWHQRSKVLDEEIRLIWEAFKSL